MVNVRGVVDARFANPSEVEEQLRVQLRGVRVVGELPLDLDGENYFGAKGVCENLIRSRNVEKLGRYYPASLCVFLVAEGRYRYHKGEFWSSLSVRTPSDPNFRAKLGGAFLASLGRLQLETFGHVQVIEQGHRYLLPILLHGGIPSYCVMDLWQLIVSEVRTGVEDGIQVLANWRDRPYFLEKLDKPAQRFMKYAGEFAEDLIGRMVEFILACQGLDESGWDELDILASKAGIPSYLLQCDLKSLVRGLALPTRAPRLRPPRPSVLLDLYAGEGPSLRLPPLAGVVASGMNWLIQGRNAHRNISASRDDRMIPLDPDSPWQVTLESDDGQISSISSFRGHPKIPVYFFDAGSGELLRHQDVLRAERILALSPKGLQFKTSESDLLAAEAEELPLLSGPWSPWMLHLLDLTGLGELRLVWSDGLNKSYDEKIQVLTSGNLPRLEGQPVKGVVSSTGLQVFDAMPRLSLPLSYTDLSRWWLQLRTQDSTMELSLDELPNAGSSVDLSGLLQPGDLLVGELAVRGPLGSDLLEQFCVVPGLLVDIPDKTFGPQEAVEIAFHAPGIYLNGNLEQVTIRDTSKHGAHEIDARGSAGRVTLRISLPRLMWKLRTNRGVEGIDSGELLTLGLDQFEDGELDAILIRAGRRTDLQLRLVGEDSTLYESELFRTCGIDGRVVVPLSPMYETIRNAGRAHMRLTVVCPDLQVDVAEIVGRYVVSNVSVDTEYSAEGDSCWFAVSFTENRAFRHRALRLWSCARIWEAALELEIDDHDHDGCLVILDQKVPPGSYLVEISVADAWLQAVRPNVWDANVARVDIGSSAELEEYLDSRDRGQVLEALEVVNSGGRIAAREFPALSDEEFDAVGRSLVQQILQWQADALEQVGFRVLVELLLEQPERFANWLAFRGPRYMTTQDLQKLGIVLLPDILDCPPENLDVRVRDRLWSLSKVLGAGFTPYRAGDQVAAQCWHYFTGWDPAMKTADMASAEESDQLPSRGGGMQANYVNLHPDRLRELTSLFCPQEVKPLRWVGYLNAAFQFLANTWSRREMADEWQLRFAYLYEDNGGREPVHESFLAKLEPEGSMPDWCQLPQLLLACAFHLVSFSGARDQATSALWEVTQFAPALTERSLLVAITLHRLGM
ncbi:hypothetical protein [Ferrimicrobium sp.]|uniref:hypothetical protein n=1 Tax=Ferrimicrobium sp. TaxID=2926050 RepID=UPI00262F84CA|nr:hypothetical protein [Ferrimicrobium sp.]